MYSSFNEQRGYSFMSLVFWLGLLAAVVLLGLKIGPLYINNSKVANAVHAIKEMPDLTTKTRSEIKSSLQKRFDLNYVEHVDNDNITIVAQPGYVKLDVDYERVEKLFGNLSVLVEFHEGFESGSR